MQGRSPLQNLRRTGSVELGEICRTASAISMFLEEAEQRPLINRLLSMPSIPRAPGLMDAQVMHSNCSLPHVEHEPHVACKQAAMTHQSCTTAEAYQRQQSMVLKPEDDACDCNLCRSAMLRSQADVEMLSSICARITLHSNRCAIRKAARLQYLQSLLIPHQVEKCDSIAFKKRNKSFATTCKA